MPKTPADKTTAELIARLEAAESGSRELSDEALLACGWTCQTGTTSGYRIKWLRPDGTRPETLPAVTESLDAALTLIPEGWLWDVASTGAVWVMPADSLDKQIVIGGIANPIIALCIAALKARQT